MWITTVLLQTVLMIVFLMSGVGKVSGLPTHVNNFKRLQLPQWFRVVTGVVQLMGAIGLAVGYFDSRWALLAGIWLALTMMGAIIAHVRVKDSLKQTMGAIVVFCFTVVYGVGWISL